MHCLKWPRGNVYYQQCLVAPNIIIVINILAKEMQYNTISRTGSGQYLKTTHLLKKRFVLLMNKRKYVIVIEKI